MEESVYLFVFKNSAGEAMVLATSRPHALELLRKREGGTEIIDAMDHNYEFEKFDANRPGVLKISSE